MSKLDKHKYIRAFSLGKRQFEREAPTVTKKAEKTQKAKRSG